MKNNTPKQCNSATKNEKTILSQFGRRRRFVVCDVAANFPRTFIQFQSTLKEEKKNKNHQVAAPPALCTRQNKQEGIGEKNSTSCIVRGAPEIFHIIHSEAEVGENEKLIPRSNQKGGLFSLRSASRQRTSLFFFSLPHVCACACVCGLIDGGGRRRQI